MAYDATNPPQLAFPRMGNGLALWLYSHTDVHTDVDGTDYFTNGHALGMRVGDFVLVGKTSATVGGTLHTVSVSTANGAVTLAPAILA
jgi:hypothetical protein